MALKIRLLCVLFLLCKVFSRYIYQVYLQFKSGMSKSLLTCNLHRYSSLLGNARQLLCTCVVRDLSEALVAETVPETLTKEKLKLINKL